MAPRKKDPSVRARRNVASSAATLSAVLPTDRRPDLPGGRDWHPLTRAWWADLWAAPMANEYHLSDRHALFLLAALMEDFWQAGGPTARKEVATEIRLQRQAFGLTPYDRRRLEWTIETVTQQKEQGERKRRTAAASSFELLPEGVDPRTFTADDKPADPRLSLVQ